MCVRPDWAKDDPERWRAHQARRVAHWEALVDKAKGIMDQNPGMYIGDALEEAYPLLKWTS